MSGGRFPKWGTPKISLSFVKIRLLLCVGEWGLNGNWRLVGWLFSSYSFSWSIYTSSFIKRAEVLTGIWIKQINRLRTPDIRSPWDWYRGWGWQRVLINASLTENWGVGLWSSFISYSVALIVLQSAWQNSIGENLSLKESMIKLLLWGCLLLFKEETFIYHQLLIRRHLSVK